MTASRPSRRMVLDAGARGAAAVLLGGPALASCTYRQAPPAPDPLEPVAQRAGADARLAASISDAHPSLAAAAAAVAADRRVHAEAVRSELRRVRPTPAPSSAVAAPSSRPPVPTDTAAARRELATALRAAHDQAAAVVGSAPGHRAGLLASIAACCASHPDGAVTFPGAGPASGQAPGRRPDDATIAALQAALGAEHAAVWAYGLIAAYLPAERAEAVADAAAAHHARRDATERLLSDAGVEPVTAAPAYRVPEPVDGPTDAQRLAVAAETDTAQTWRSAIERSSLRRVRAAAVDTLTGAAVRAARWRAAAGDETVTVPFPGTP